MSKVDIFDKDMVVVPINENLHWYSAVIFNPGALLEDGIPMPQQTTKNGVTQQAASTDSSESGTSVEPDISASQSPAEDASHYVMDTDADNVDEDSEIRVVDEAGSLEGGGGECIDLSDDDDNGDNDNDNDDDDNGDDEADESGKINNNNINSEDEGSVVAPTQATRGAIESLLSIPESPPSAPRRPLKSLLTEKSDAIEINDSSFDGEFEQDRFLSTLGITGDRTTTDVTAAQIADRILSSFTSPTKSAVKVDISGMDTQELHQQYQKDLAAAPPRESDAISLLSSPHPLRHSVSAAPPGSSTTKRLVDRCHILIFDSLHINRVTALTNIRELLYWSARGRRGIIPTVAPQSRYMRSFPKQDNHCDCGVFVLQIVEWIMENYDTLMPKIVEKRDSPSDWFGLGVIRRKRREIFDMCEKIQIQYAGTKSALEAKEAGVTLATSRADAMDIDEASGIEDTPAPIDESDDDLIVIE
ncbi:cysteine proteinase [Ramicandelaber brevisporus]|nr:cysteine proteinase [Ramicandelaber brevisporus]